MATPGGLVDKQELIDAQLDTGHLGRVVNSKDASGNPINTSTNRTGGVNKTLDALQDEYEEAIAGAVLDSPTKIPTVNYGAGFIVVGPSAPDEYPLNQGVVRTAGNVETIVRFAGGLEDLPYDMSQPFDESKWLDANLVRRHLVYSTSNGTLVVTDSQTTLGPFYSNGEVVNITSAQVYLQGSKVSELAAKVNPDGTTINIGTQILARHNIEVVINSIVDPSSSSINSLLVFNAGDYGELGTSDDSVTINKCIDAARGTINPAERSPEGNGVVIKIGRDVTIKNPINMTGFRPSYNVVFDGDGASINCEVPNGIGIDAIGSKRIVWQNFSLWGDKASNVRFGLGIGRRATNETADDHAFYNVAIHGYFTKGSHYNLASESPVYTNCWFINEWDDGDDAYTAIFDSYHSFGYTSTFEDLSGLQVDVASSFNNVVCTGVRFYRRPSDGNNSIGYSMYMDQNCQGFSFRKCYAVAARTAAINLKYRNLTSNGWRDMRMIDLGLHVEKFSQASSLLWMVNITSDSTSSGAAGDFNINGVNLSEHNLNTTASAFHAEDSISLVRMYGADVTISETKWQSGTAGEYPTLALPAASFAFFGNLNLTSKMDPQLFRNASDVLVNIIGKDFLSTDSATSYVAGAEDDCNVTVQNAQFAYKLEQVNYISTSNAALPFGCTGLAADGKTLEVKSL